MIRTFYTLDWLRFSVDQDFDLSQSFKEACFQPVNEQHITPYPAYNRAVQWEIGRYDWHADKPEQRKLVTFTGGDFRSLRLTQVGQHTLLDRVLHLPNVKITRLDYAVDIVSPGLRAIQIADLIDEGKVISPAKRHSIVRSQIEGQKEGVTVYIGSRASETFLRAYDKGVESGKDFDWLRIEIEVKGRRAMALAFAMIKTSLFTAGCGAIKVFANVPIPEIQEALEGAGEIDFKLGAKDTDWEAWIKKIVLPNLERAFRAGLPEVRETIIKIYYQIIASDNIS